MEPRLNSFGTLFDDWSRTEQARLLEQIRWLESGSRHIAVRTGKGQWVDVTENELMRLKLTFTRLDALRIAQERERKE